MGNQICTECNHPVSAIDNQIPQHLTGDAPENNFAYPQKIQYQIPCDVNHLLTDFLPINRNASFQNAGQKQEEQQTQNQLIGTKIDESFFVVPYSVYYTGQWKNGRPHGLGQVVFSSGSVLNATFNKGIVEGADSLYIMPTGTYYRGNMRFNNFNGNGTFKEPNGHTYEGQWKDNIPEGYGRETFENKDRYVGKYIKGRKNGDACIYYWYQHPNYKQYQGSFTDDYFLGYGKMTLRDGTIITGLYREDLIQKASLKNQYYQYEGDMKNGKLSGNGKIKFLNTKQTYQGNFQEGQMHGFGTLISPNGQKKVGKWFKGTHIRQYRNFSDQQLELLIQTTNKIFNDHKYFDDALQELNKKVKSLDTKYSVKELSDGEIKKINQDKFCILQISDNLIGIFG